MTLVRHTLPVKFNMPVSVHAVDIDADGDVDILAAVNQANGITLLRNEGKMRFRAYTIASDFLGASDVCAADLDGDKDMDVVATAKVSGALAWWEQKTAGPTDDLIFSSQASPITLHENTPNPFGRTTMITYTLHASDRVTLSVYNSVGQEVRKLTSEAKNAGKHSVTWDARDDGGAAVPNGVYLLKCKVGDYTTTQKLILMR